MKITISCTKLIEMAKAQVKAILQSRKQVFEEAIDREIKKIEDQFLVKTGVRKVDTSRTTIAAMLQSNHEHRWMYNYDNLGSSTIQTCEDYIRLANLLIEQQTHTITLSRKDLRILGFSI